MEVPGPHYKPPEFSILWNNRNVEISILDVYGTHPISLMKLRVNLVKFQHPQLLFPDDFVQKSEVENGSEFWHWPFLADQKVPGINPQPSVVRRNFFHSILQKKSIYLFLQKKLLV